METLIVVYAAVGGGVPAVARWGFVTVANYAFHANDAKAVYDIALTENIGVDDKVGFGLSAYDKAIESLAGKKFDGGYLLYCNIRNEFISQSACGYLTMQKHNSRVDRHPQRVVALEHVQIPAIAFFLMDLLEWLSLPLRVVVWVILSGVYFASVKGFLSGEDCNHLAYKSLYVSACILLFLIAFFRINRLFSALLSEFSILLIEHRLIIRQ